MALNTLPQNAQPAQSTASSPFSDFRVTIVEKDSLRAVVSCKVGGAIWLSGMRVVEGSKGRFLAMPSRKTTEGDYQDIYFPATREMRERLQREALAQYEQTLTAA